MKKLIGFAVAGALLAGTQTVLAQNVPSSGGSDLWLFVSDQANKNTFAVDTGVTVSSLLSSSDLVSGAALVKLNHNFSLLESDISSTNALSSYLGSHTGLEWGAVGVNWPSASTSTSNSTNQTPGGTVGIFSASAGASAQVANYGLSGLVTWASGFNSDVGYVIGTTYVPGGQTYSFTAGSNTGQVWGGNPGGAAGGSVTEYSTGPSQAGFAPGSSEELYAVTGNGNNGVAQTYELGTLTLGTDGSLTLLQQSAPVPLPAAVWLFGSGLLGLAGIGRRRAAAAGSDPVVGSPA
jgi:hypothetical protein